LSLFYQKKLPNLSFVSDKQGRNFFKY